MKPPNFLEDRQNRIILALAVVALFLFMRYHTAEMDPRFFQLTMPGIQGLALYQIGDYKGAAESYQVHYRQQYRDGWTSGDPAKDAFLRGETDEAKRAVSKTLAEDPDDTEALVLAGQIELEEGQYEQALRYFRHALNQTPTHDDALVLSALTHTRQGTYDEALDHMKVALRVVDLRAWWTRLVALLVAVGELEALPSEEQPACLLAHYFRYLRVFDPANGNQTVRYAHQAIETGDRPDDAYLTIGVVAYLEGDQDEALEEFRQAIELNAGNADAMGWAAKVYARRGDLTNEYKMRKAAVEAAPHDPFFADRLIDQLTRKLGDFHQAVEMAQRSVAGVPTPERLLRLGRLYSYLQEHERALAVHQEVLELDPDNAKAHASIGYSLLELGKRPEAIDALKQAIASQPGYAYPHEALGRIYWEMFDEGRLDTLETAIAEYEKAVELEKRGTDTHARLCGLYASTEEYPRAAECYKQVLAIDPDNSAALSGYGHLVGVLERSDKRI